MDMIGIGKVKVSGMHLKFVNVNLICYICGASWDVTLRSLIKNFPVFLNELACRIFSIKETFSL
jgi:hypothetical protein